MSPEDFKYHLTHLYKPVIAGELRKIEELIKELGCKAIEAGADEDEVNELLENARFNQDGWWDEWTPWE